MKYLFSSFYAGAILSTTAFSGETLRDISPSLAEPRGRIELPAFDIARLDFLQTGAMDFDNGPGDLSVTQYGFRSFLTKPIELAEGLTYVPMLSYSLTSLNFENSPVFPLDDEDLHTASLHSFFVKTFDNSPWFGVAWNRVSFSSDYQEVNSDSFTFDAAVGVGYKVNESFTVGLGGVVMGINNDVQFLPGFNFDWKICDQFRAGLYGPNLLATYRVNDQWNLSLRGQPNGGTWVFDDNNQSRTIELSSYALGLYTENNIYKSLWLTAGVGYTFGNEIQRRDNGGGNGVSSDLDGAPYFEVSLGLRRW